MACKTRIFNDCILVGEALDFPINWTMEFANLWEPNQAFANGIKVRPTTLELQTGFDYSSSGGQSDGDTEPPWPTALAETVADGSIAAWTAGALSFDSLRERIDTVEWEAPVGFTVSDEEAIIEPGRQITTARIGADAAMSGKHDIKVLVTTTAGNEYVGIIRLKVE